MIFRKIFFVAAIILSCSVNSFAQNYKFYSFEIIQTGKEIFLSSLIDGEYSKMVLKNVDNKFVVVNSEEMAKTEIFLRDSLKIFGKLVSKEGGIVNNIDEFINYLLNGRQLQALQLENHLNIYKSGPSAIVIQKNILYTSTKVMQSQENQYILYVLIISTLSLVILSFPLFQKLIFLIRKILHSKRSHNLGDSNKDSTPTSSNDEDKTITSIKSALEDVLGDEKGALNYWFHTLSNKIINIETEIGFLKILHNETQKEEFNLDRNALSEIEKLLEVRNSKVDDFENSIKDLQIILHNIAEKLEYRNNIKENKIPKLDL
ncbi:MAG: hypothetical protein NTX65_14880 [Ignavibacteriales bacterium]|nr:hypothetical protein [Ignavibacteriales bacterium]